MLTSQVPAALQFIYGEQTSRQDQLLIYGSALTASSVAVVLGELVYHQSVWQQMVTVVLVCDLVGGGVAHLLPANRLFWRSLQPEWLVVWTALYAWPLLFTSAFGLLKATLFDQAPPRSGYYHRPHRQVVVMAQHTTG